MTFILFLLVFVVVGTLVYRLTTSEDRARYLAIALDIARHLKAAAMRRRPEYELFRDALRARTRYVLVTPAVVAINIAVVGFIVFGAQAIGDPGTLVAWGASLGTRTTNGEWWRLVTSAFVHTGTWHLLVDVAVLIQLGVVLERLAGRLAFAAVYLSAGTFAGLMNISSHPVDVSVGASGAIFGLYGLLLASLIWQVFRRRADPEPDADDQEDSSADPEPDVDPEAPRADFGVTIPLIAMKRLGVGAAVFLLYSALSGLARTPEFTGLLVGLAYGLVLARRVSEKNPDSRYVGAAMVATGVIAVAFAMPLRHIADVQPDISRVLATEERTAAEYHAAYDAFTRDRITAEALAQVAERTVPQLQTADAGLEALVHVPAEHQGLVADAREFLRLRCASWRARADALRRAHGKPRDMPDGTTVTSWRLQSETRFRSNLAAMGRAESAERASLEVFQRIRQAAPLSFSIRLTP